MSSSLIIIFPNLLPSPNIGESGVGVGGGGDEVGNGGNFEVGGECDYKLACISGCQREKGAYSKNAIYRNYTDPLEQDKVSWGKFC